MKIRYDREVPDGPSCLGCGKLQQRHTGPECELFREDCPGAVKCASCVASKVKDFDDFWDSLSENTKSHLRAMHRIDAFEQIYMGLVHDAETERINGAEFMATLIGGINHAAKRTTSSQIPERY